MKIRYTATALRELAEILAYVEERNPTAAKSISLQVQEAVERLSYFPYLAQETELEGIRRLPLRNYPYVIFYAVDAEEVVILRIRHGARRPLWDTR